MPPTCPNRPHPAKLWRQINFWTVRSSSSLELLQIGARDRRFWANLVGQITTKLIMKM
jgi:hypothetical protein